MVPLSFADEDFCLVGGRALYWPREKALLVADLHLEKGSFYAGHGQPIPPYDSRETLERIAQAIRETGARRVITLGDNFHDHEGAGRLEPYAADMLDSLTRSVDWVWITGNHDAPERAVRGSSVTGELELSGVILRHRALPGESRPEMSGHFHPRLRLTIRQRTIRRPCAVIGAGGGNGADGGKGGGQRMILPAFGAYTGGMNAADPAIIEALQPAAKIDALLPAAGRIARFPLWRRAA